MRTLVVIPARLESTRLPRKLLLAATGKPLIVHTVEQVKLAGFEVMVATDSHEIAEVVSVHTGATVFLNGLDHPNGTSRMAEIAGLASGVDLFVNVQGDEPEIDQRLIVRVVEQLSVHPEWDCATAACVRYSDSEHRVKCWVDVRTDLATGFSRKMPDLQGGFPCCGNHIGIYAYRRDALLKYAAAGPCAREQAESLEQLRALHVGLKMGVVLWDGEHHGGIDTQEDYDRFVQRKAAKL